MVCNLDFNLNNINLDFLTLLASLILWVYGNCEPLSFVKTPYILCSLLLH